MSHDDETVAIETSTALRRAGFERALARAGIALAAEGTSPSIVVRTSDDLPTAAPIEISVGSDEVQVILRADLTPATWESLRRVVDELMSATEPGAPA